MPFLRKGDTVALIACSDGWNPADRPALSILIEQLRDLGLSVRLAQTIFRTENRPFSGSPKARAEQLMAFFRDPAVRMIFDLSGGDSANQILPFLDYPAIARSQAIFCGISDLSVINNALYAQTGKHSIHYRIKNLTGSFADAQINWFRHVLMGADSIAPPAYHWLRGQAMTGELIGGNLRCFLKLAATDYFPDPAGKIVLLEALGGGAASCASLLAQLDQIGVFRQCSGIVLGTFTAMRRSGEQPSIQQLTLAATARYQLPIAETEQIGHGDDAFGMEIGATLQLD
ncbi:MAG: LD-carboxypeptidase [Sporolactobacillus sp.]